MTATCYSPFEQGSYRLDLSHLETPHFDYPLTSTHGWLLLDDFAPSLPPSNPPPFSGFLSFSLFNPISKLRIQLPTTAETSSLSRFAVSSSSPYLPPNHNFSILALDFQAHFLLFRLGLGWTPLQLPPDVPSLPPLEQCEQLLFSSIFTSGKFYCLLPQGNLLVVDPYTAPDSPIIHYFQMAGFPTPQHQLRDMIFLESDGDLLLVCQAASFELFRADVARKLWVRIERLGGGGGGDDRVLLLDNDSAYSVLAADLGAQGQLYCFP